MANPKRHGGHILPEEVAFPPAHPSAPDTYVYPDIYTPVDPYHQPGSAPPPPATPPPTTPVPAPPRDGRNARHGGTMSPEDAYPEKSSVAVDTMSTTSTKLRKASGGSATTKRHGGSKSPEEDYGQIVRSPPTQPPPHPPRFESANHHSPSPSYATDKPGYTKEYVQERIYPVTNNSSAQAIQPSYAPQPQSPEIGKRKMHQIGYRNIWNLTSTIRWFKAVHFHKRANLKYGQTLYRHRDAAGRVYQGVDEERFILTQDVHLARMLVQAADDIYKGDSSATWRRTFIRNKAPLMIRLANWPTNAVPSHRKHWTNQDWTRVALIWPVACLGLCIAFLQLGPTYSYYPANMKYPALVYKYWGYAKVSRNALESPNAQSAEGTSTDATHPVAERPLNPRCLWIQDPSSKAWEKVVVEHWLGPNNESPLLLPFILVAYTANQFDHDSQSDINALHRVARQAAADAGVEAYWCADSCMSTDPDEMEQDVWRISDVIRAAHSLTIALKQPNTASRAYSDDMLLKDWGSRMWTLPEALLGPKDNPVRMYRSNAGSASLVRTADRRQLPPMLWADAPLTRQLVDHYEGNITLSRLELVILALKALSARSTSPYLKGDLAYILMGLLRRRPHVDATDSQFQAFARLSLANDSDRLLERLFCVQPVTPDQPWYLTDDAYKVNLWDIEPTCQIAAICDNDTVVIDGCFAAAIRWETFYAPWHRRNTSWRRLAADLTIRGFTILFMIAFWILIIGAAQKASSSSSSLKKRQYSYGFSSSSTTTSSPQSLIVTGGVLLGLSLPIWILSPWLTRILFGGKAWDVAPYLFGFEGHLDIETIESMIYGFPSGRLKWSIAGSNLSRHRKNDFGECMGDDPTNDPAVMEKVERAKTASFGDMRVFTLVDTRHGLVTMFEAVRPPSATLLCAQEGGMTRAVMVSLDWKTSTLYRETVLRMPTPMIQDCWRVDRVRVGLKRPMEDVVPCLEV